ncbi:hypothetical protein [Amycolatopsis vancoresmycina]|uniref:hypothetical protein n=1 Tax=Amycolatopsis vancoresmycina TaxID=208444 RepID=UPI000587F5C7|nr:hypothetical protein [Amycolatopsis vancoresmycina]
MRFVGGIFAVACLLTCVTACSGGSTTAAPATTSAPPSSTSVSKPTPTPTTPKFAAVVSPEKVTAACPFLGGSEVRELTGRPGEKGEGTEGKSEDVNPGTAYHCGYGLNGELVVVALPGAQSPSATIGRLNKECKEPAKPIPGAGEYASHCKFPDGEEMVAIGKRGHGQSRFAQFYTPTNREDVYVSVAKLLGDRL